MSTSQPDGWHTVTPRIVVRDPETLVTFLRDVFGASGHYHAERPAEMRIGDSVVMLVYPGGQERTEAEYASLLGKAGFRVNRVVPTESVASIVEALPA